MRLKGIGDRATDAAAERDNLAIDEGETHTKLRGDHLCQEGAAGQGTDDRPEAMGRQSPRQLAREG
jgi:hypothetical protein